MEPNKGEAKVQKGEKLVTCLDIPDCDCAYWRLDSVFTITATRGRKLR
ncbi:Uncharacterised protein [Salmonella bongori]|nr:Uncharacterised protein [Salmonella bongori]